MRFSLFATASLFATTFSQEVCYMPLDVMFLQDTTGSFDDDLPNVLKQIPDMVQTITETFPKSWFGVAEFKDKPHYPLGEHDDFCYKLGDGKLSGLVEDFQWAYSLLYASGGGDLPEAQFQALINIALDSNVGWRKLAESGVRAEKDEAGARVLIMSTDAQPHLPGDMNRFDPILYPEVPHNLPVNSGGISTGDVNYECLYQDYPSAEQVRDILKKAKIYFVILTPNDPVVVPAWKWVNEELLGQPADFYQIISHDSSDLLDGVLKAVEAVTQEACPTTTTPPPGESTSSTESESQSAESGTGDSSTSSSMGELPSTTTAASDLTTKPDCPTPCPPGPDPCPPCPEECHCPPHCHDECEENPCNEGVIIKISDKPKAVNITIA